MLKFCYISGKNLVLYKSFFYDFTAAPLQIVRGSNRSGKSLLFSTLGNILYNSSMLDQRRGSGRRMHSNNSITEVGLINGKGKWRFCQLGTGKNIVYNIFHNDKELRPTRINDAQKIIADAVTKPQDLFYTTDLLNPDRGHPLLSSKPGVRYDYFEEAFDLDIYDVIHQHLLKKSGDIRAAATTLAQLQQQHDELLEEREELSPKEQFQYIEAQWRRLQQQHNLRIKQAQAIAAWLAIVEMIKSKDAPQVIAKELEINSKLLPQLHQLVQDGQRRLSDYQAYLKHQQQLIRIQNRLALLPNKYKLDDLQKDFQKWQQRANLLRMLRPLLQEFIEKEKTWQPMPVINTASQKNDEQELIISLNFLKNLNKISGPHCPTCGQSIDPLSLQQMRQILQIKISKLEKQIAYIALYQDNLRIKERMDELQREICASDDGQHFFNNRNRIAAIDQQIDDKSKISEGQIAEALHRQDLLQEQITLKNVMPHRVKPIDEKTVVSLQHDYEKMQKRCNFLQNELELHEKLAKTGNYGDPVNVRQYYQQLQQHLERDNISINNLQQELQVIRDKLTRHNLQQQELHKLFNKISILQKETAQADIYEYLLLAYGSKGLRINVVKNLAEAWLNGMNNNAHFIFAEPYRFSLDIDINRFIILAERSANIAEISSTLSGSERSCFALLNMMTLLELLPDHYRSNIAILDECNAHMDEISTQLFATDFLPRLSTIVPHITVVTPTELFVPDAQEFRVVKTKGISQLIKA